MPIAGSGARWWRIAKRDTTRQRQYEHERLRNLHRDPLLRCHQSRLRGPRALTHHWLARRMRREEVDLGAVRQWDHTHRVAELDDALVVASISRPIDPAQSWLAGAREAHDDVGHSRRQLAVVRCPVSRRAKQIEAVERLQPVRHVARVVRADGRRIVIRELHARRVRMNAREQIHVRGRLAGARLRASPGAHLQAERRVTRDVQCGTACFDIGARRVQPQQTRRMCSPQRSRLRAIRRPASWPD